MIAIMSVDFFPLFDDGSLRTLAKEETLFLTGAPVRLAIQAAWSQMLAGQMEPSTRATIFCS